MKDEFMDVLMNNNAEEIKKYLLKNGKKPKPIAPFYFIKKDKEENINVSGKK